MEEIWKEVSGYEGLYEVSDQGRVRSLCYLHTGQTKILKPCKNRKGYLVVNLWKEGQKKFFCVHRLVARAFVPNPGNLPQVNHRNECKTDNRTENLEWCSPAYNSNYGTRNERLAKALAKAKSRPVLQFDKSGDLVKEWSSAIEVERQTGWGHGNISKCCHGKYKTAYGFLWSLEGDEPKLFKPCDTMRPVCQYDRQGALVARYATMKEAAAAVGSSVSNLRKCCIGAPHYNTAKGFRWAFAD